MQRYWTTEDVLKLASSYQGACVLAAAADLDLFTAFGEQSLGVRQAAEKMTADLRGVAVLLDALTAMGVLEKHGEQYAVTPGLRPLMAAGAPGNVLAMAQHQANCLRRWSHLAATVKTGHPAERQPSIRGADADYASFIEAMDNISGPVAAKVVADLGPLQYRHVLDVGGASGTWAIAFLMGNPQAMATIFDLPVVMPHAQERVARAGLASRVRLVPGDFYLDPLPGGADLAWVSAIIHQNSRAQNRELFARVFEAIAPGAGGRILIRDIVMEESRTEPLAGAMFAVNMLVGTPQGGTYTFAEISEDLAAAGFTEPAILRRDPGMNSVVAAKRP